MPGRISMLLDELVCVTAGAHDGDITAPDPAGAWMNRGVPEHSGQDTTPMDTERWTGYIGGGG